MSHPVEESLRASRISFVTWRVTAWTIGLVAPPFILVGTLLGIVTFGLAYIVLIPVVLVAYALAALLAVLSRAWFAAPFARPLLFVPGLLLAVVSAALVSLAMHPGEPRPGKTGRMDMLSIVCAWPATHQAFDHWRTHGWV